MGHSAPYLDAVGSPAVGYEEGGHIAALTPKQFSLGIQMLYPHLP